jgi:cytochrome c553
MKNRPALTSKIARLTGAIAATLTIGVGHAAQPPKALDTIAQRVTPCTTCHGKEGRATNEGYFPRIAGKPAGYLYNQLVNFREGRRNYALMTYLVDHLTDAYLLEMAQYFASLDLPYPPPQKTAAPHAVLNRGEKLVREGDRGRDIPACNTCHGETLTGIAPAIPGLLGLSSDYLQAQLGHWKSGERRALQPDCMAKVAARLTPEEVGAVAAWLAAQPVPADAKPARSAASKLPMECGGVPK